MKKILKIVTALLLLFITVATGVTYYFYKNVKPILEQEINKALAVEVHFSELKVSGIKDFPKLGVTFSGIKINESTPHYNQKLLVATELSLFLDILKIWKGEYVIDAVTLRNGQLNMADLKNGTNYDIIKPTESKSSTPLSFEIKKLTLINCNLAYQYVPDKLNFTSYTPKSKIKIKYLDAKTELNVQANLLKTFLTYSDEQYITNKKVKINTALDILTNKSFLSIAQSDLIIENIELKTAGTLYYGSTQTINLQFESNNTSAQSLLSILPKSTQTSLSDLKLSGDVQLAGLLKGPISASKSPSFTLDYKLANASISATGQPISLSGINALGKLEIPSTSNLTNASTTCTIEQAKSGNNELNGVLMVKNFASPKLHWNGKADLEVPFLSSLTKNSYFSADGGRLKIIGELSVQYDAEKGEMEENSFYFAGSILGEQISGKIANPSIKVNSIDFNISADDTKMAVNQLTFSYNDVKGKVIGYVTNYHSLFNTDSKSELAGKLEINNLNLNDLTFVSSNSDNENSHNNGLIPLKINLQSVLRNFSYNDFKATEISGHLISDNQQIAMPECRISALEGNIVASVALKKWGDNYLLDINSNLTEISIAQLFKQFNNFNQNEITHENLTGKLSGNILTKLIFNADFEPILPKLYAKANVTITDGQLKNYEPLKSLSDFVEIKDLEDVKFKTLQNTIEIFDQTIFIPKMRIENSAINLELEGTHTFDNYMDYHLALSVAELLATKANWIAKKKERRIENNINGGLTAYITMQGTPEDLKIAYDRATVKQNVKEEMAKEKTNFIKALKGEATLEEQSTESKNYDDVWDE